MCLTLSAIKLNHPLMVLNNQDHNEKCAGVAQLVRVSACHAEGRGFESRHSRHLGHSPHIDVL